MSLAWRTALAAISTAVSAQPAIPIRDLSVPSATSSRVFGTVLGIRDLPGGKLLVNDAGNRQLILLDSTLASPVVVFDSVMKQAQSYGPRPTPLISYLGDSSLFVDGASAALLLIDPAGTFVRAVAPPQSRDLRFLAGSASRVDARGNLIYRVAAFAPPQLPKKNGDPQVIQQPDSAPIVRASFENRRVDTIARVRVNNGSRTEVQRDENGRVTSTRFVINPVVTIDEWAVLSDGSVAIVRGQDYHIDWIRTNGTMESTPKLPFDWKRITDEEKQKLIDSARTSEEKQLEGARQAMEKQASAVATEAPRPAPPPLPQITFVPLREIFDYYPPIRFGAVRADLERNVWILPTTTAQSSNGELVYDVVNASGRLFQRVRVPSGRSIAGFGKNGVVYLAAKLADGWAIERTRIRP